MDLCSVNTCFRFVLFIIGPFFLALLTVLLVHLRLKHRENLFFFDEDNREDNSPRAISCYQAKSKESDQYYKGNHKKTQKRITKYF